MFKQDDKWEPIFIFDLSSWQHDGELSEEQDWRQGRRWAMKVNKRNTYRGETKSRLTKPQQPSGDLDAVGIVIPFL